MFKLISRLFYFYLFNKVSKKNNNYRGTEDINKKEGDVSIDKMPKKNTKNVEPLIMKKKLIGINIIVLNNLL